MKNRHGFLLVSLSIYLICFALLVLGSLRIFVPGLLQMHAYHKKIQASIDAHLIIDQLFHDLWQAPKNIHAWPVHSSTTIIWHSGTDYIGWTNTPEGIKRIQGNYDIRSNTWHKKSQSLIASHGKIQFRADYNHEWMLALYIQVYDDHNRIDTVWSFYGQ
jgi:hypothetical protein